MMLLTSCRELSTVRFGLDTKDGRYETKIREMFSVLIGNERATGDQTFTLWRSTSVPVWHAGPSFDKPRKGQT